MDSALPVLADACEVANNEKISRILFTDRAHPLTGSPGAIGSWGTRLTNTAEGSDTVHPIRTIEVFEAERPLPTPNYVNSVNGNNAQRDYTDYEITFIDDDDSDAKRAFYEPLQCNGNVLMWYVSGPHLYGPQEGIKCVIKPVYGIVKTTDGMAHRWSVTISWRAKCDEPRFELVI